MAGRPPCWDNPEVLQMQIDAYFDYCDNYKSKQLLKVKVKNEDGTEKVVWDEEEEYAPRRYTLSGLARFLGCDRGTIANYHEKEEFFSTIDAARTRILEQMEESLLSNRGSSAGHIFVLKNGFKFVDKSEVVTISKSLGDELNEMEKEKANQLKNAGPSTQGQELPAGTSLPDQE